MIDKSVTAKFLQRLCSIYEREYGPSVARLEEFVFDYRIVASDQILAELIDRHFDPEEQSRQGDSFELVFEELKHQGFLRQHPDNSFGLTREGYREGSSTQWEKALSFLNRNPGLSIVISILSFLVALGALAFSLYGA